MKCPEATGHCVVVIPDQVQETTKGGVILTRETLERDQAKQIQGTLASVSPIAFLDIGSWPEGSRKPQVGDKVVVRRYAALQINPDAQSYEDQIWVVEDKAVVAILERAPDSAAEAA